MPPYTILSASRTTPTLHLHHPSTTTPHQTLTSFNPPNPQSIAITPTHIHCLSLNATATTTSIQHYTPPRRPPLCRSAPPEPLLSCLTTSHDTTLLIAGGESGRIHIWTLCDGALIRSWQAHLRSVDAIAFTDDDETILSTGEDAVVNIFSALDVLDVTRSQTNPPLPRAALVGHTLPIVGLAVGYGGTNARVATISKDRTMKVWHLASARCIATILLEWSPTAVVMTRDEGRAFVAGNGVICVHLGKLSAIVSAKRLAKFADGEVSAMTISPNGEHLVVGFENGGVKIFDMNGGVVGGYDKLGTGQVVCVRCVENVEGGGEVRLGKVVEQFDPVWGAEEQFTGSDLEQVVEKVFEERKEEKKDGEERLLREIEILRRRNLELERAGRKLLTMVERS